MTDIHIVATRTLPISVDGVAVVDRRRALAHRSRAAAVASRVDKARIWMSTSAAVAPAVVVVDDEVAIAELLRRLLRDLTRGYDILIATTGEGALPYFEQRTVPLVITDLNLPGMNGLELATAIRERSPDTRVILITAYATPTLTQRALKQHVDYFLPKPFTLNDLDQMVRAALTQAREPEL
jgi:CheY-like chemotaxis protein